ncbi:hypothetical protein [uncultured Roseibium sp.]|uniref:hypothetical protein n=1 Tax=uncultured Roseibium sp. TaxID=1936171 RepID=UPI0026131728|nr:hypothetical protein [uncultured Roseibium sp.]
MKKVATKLTPGLRGRSKSGKVTFDHDSLTQLNQASLCAAQSFDHTPGTHGEQL